MRACHRLLDLTLPVKQKNNRLELPTHPAGSEELFAIPHPIVQDKTRNSARQEHQTECQRKQPRLTTRIPSSDKKAARPGPSGPRNADWWCKQELKTARPAADGELGVIGVAKPRRFASRVSYLSQLACQEKPGLTINVEAGHQP
jgi:hypothetical protein